MSYPLHCHTPLPRDPDSTGLPPVETTILGADLWENTSTQYGTGEQDNPIYVGYCGNPYASIFGIPQQKSFAVSADGQKIMVVRSFAGRFEYSDDGGDTWTIKAMTGMTDDAYAGAYWLQDIQYDDSTDTWYVVWMYDVIQLAAQQRRGYIYRSSDAGTTWTRLTTSPAVDRDQYKCIVMQNGTIMAHATRKGGTNENLAVCYTTPTVDGTYSSISLGVAVSSYIRFACEIAGGYLLTNGPLGLMVIHPGGTAYTVLGTNPGSLIGVGSNPNGVALMVDSVVSNVINYVRITAASTEPYEAGSITLDNPPNAYQFAYGGGKYIFVCGDSTDYSRMEVWTSDTGVDGTWAGPYFWDLGRDKEPSADSSSGQSLYENSFHLRHTVNGEWILHFRDESDHKHWMLVKVAFGEVSSLPNLYGPLRTAINAQAPAIFYRLDDTGSPTQVVDDGRQGYTNAVYGAGLTFEQAGLVSDDGTAVLLDGTADIGIMADDVGSTDEHAHVFIFSHDDTAAERILAASGDLTDPDDAAYYIYLTTDHKLAVATYNSGWTHTTSPTVIAAATGTLAAVRVRSGDGEVDIYLEDELDTIGTGLTIQAATNTKLSVLGGWNGATDLQDSADGVTLDYYVLIDNSNFDYSAINEAWGGTYTRPDAETSVDGGTVEFLIHADEAALSGPNPSMRTSATYYNLVNSVPGSINRVSTEIATGRLVTTDQKFGAGSAYVESHRPYVDSFTPWNNIYWPIANASAAQMGLPELTLGKRSFTYDLWLKSLDTGPAIAGSNNWLVRSGSRYYSYGGMVIIVSPEPANNSLARVTIKVGSTKSEASARPWQFQLEFKNIPGYLVNDWNHIAISRGHLGHADWRVFVNGNRAPVPSLTEYKAGSFVTNYIYSGEAWSIGVQPVANITAHSKVGGAILIDEARFITDEAVFTDSFTPPTAAYSL